ncbi:MAG: hypothetical protein WAT79_05695 [Saprospiraceae bacterium]
MNKSKLLTFLAVGLFLSNLLLIGFILIKKPKRPFEEGPKKMIAERLHFDADQYADYEALIKKHFDQIQKKDSMIIVSKNTLYACIRNGNKMLKDSMLTNLGKLQMEVEDIHYQHFLDIGNICTEDQLKDYDLLLNDVAKLFSREKRNKPRD